MPTSDGWLLLRVILIAFGAILTRQGIGDAVMWEAVIGALMAVAGATWSWLERLRLKASPSAEVGRFARLVISVIGQRPG